MAVPLPCTATGPEVPAAAPPTEMPGPKLAVVVPEGKLVPTGIMVTLIVEPVPPEAGESVKLGCVTVNDTEFALWYPEPAKVIVYVPAAVPRGMVKFTTRFTPRP